MRYAFIHAHATTWRITTMCRVLQVSRAGFYKWRAEPFGLRKQADAALLVHVRQQFYRLRRRYGSPRLCRELRAAGHQCSEKRVARLMRVAGLRAKGAHRFVVTTNSAHAQPVAPNVLARRFAVHEQPGLNRRWAADITYVPTREGWLYLAVVVDLASRRVVGWGASVRLDHELALAALQMARRQRNACGVLHHSDRGSQYASVAYQRALRDGGLAGSMSRKGDCWDNAVVESFFATLTKELLDDGPFDTREAARRAVAEFIDVWYNRERQHSSLGFRSPVQYETQLLRAG
ncbi:MAG: IS3 family transposase [Gemmatimonadaceae bacterium]